MIVETTSDYDREKYQERLAKMAGGVAIIRVGAATEAEMKEKKARVEDALHATRAAIEEGIVPGGGVALIRAASVLEKAEFNDAEAIALRFLLKRSKPQPNKLLKTPAKKAASSFRKLNMRRRTWASML